jgi:GT2 family glycosyltransferase
MFLCLFLAELQVLESDAQVSGGSAFDVLAVIVLYKMRFNESAAFKTLMAARSVLPRQTELQVLLYDNSPDACTPGTLPVGVRYEASQRNAGLAAAYNRAVAIANNERTTWIVTLDQDTTLPMNFLLQMRECIRIVERDDRVAAIVPRLRDADRALSPVVVKFFGEQHVSKTFTGISEQEIRGLNSASLFRVSALNEIGGYDPYFWLDYVDTCIFRKLHLQGRRIYVAGKIQVEHELSLLHRGNLAPDRFRNVLQAECAFCDLFDGRARGFVLTARLLGRIWRQRRRGDNIAFRRLTWEMFKMRLFQSKAKRILEWRKEVEQRIICPTVIDSETESLL